MRFIVSAGLLSCSLLACSYSGIPVSDKDDWMNVAHLYCFMIWIMQMICMVLYWIKNKSVVRSKSRQFRRYCRKHIIMGPVMRGCIMAIPLGLTCYVIEKMLSIIAFFPILLLVVALPIGLFKERWFRKPIWTEIGAGVSVSFITTSIIFAVLACTGVLKGSDIVYLTQPHLGTLSPCLSHPYDSLKLIWTMPELLMVESIVSGVIIQLIVSASKMNEKGITGIARIKVRHMCDVVFMSGSQKRAKYKS